MVQSTVPNPSGTPPANGNADALILRGMPHMSGDAVTTTYSIPEPFELGLPAVREALAGRNFNIIGQLDLSHRIRRSLRISMDPCVVYYVWPRTRLLQNENVPLALFLPLHIVVSGHGTRTEIHILRRLRFDNDPAAGSLGALQAEVTKAIESIAMRLSLVG
jgi:uncharacterized protein (DUF302 family)